MKLALPLCFFILCLPLSWRAQLVTSSDQTVEWYVENVLLGGGVSVENVTLNGYSGTSSDLRLGYFDGSSSNVGLDEGVIIATGDIANAEGPNDQGAASLPAGGSGAGDSDLSDIIDNTTYDAAVLEFDFIPEGDTLSFDFVFASDEYPEFSNGNFNDVFAFFISGPGLSGPYSSPAAFPDGSTNIALLPGTTTPVSINSVNNGTNGTGPCMNCAYYVDNGNGFESPYNSDPQYIQYDGFTTPLTAVALVECGETYHIKIAIADAFDSGYDSAVFLEAGSFSSSDPIIADLGFPIDGSLTDNVLYEDCFEGTLLFERTSGIDQEETVALIIGGSAINGVDYTPIPPFIVFAPGETEYGITVAALADATIEGEENVTISVQASEQSCNSEPSEEFEFFITENTPAVAMSGDVYEIDCNETLTIGGNDASGGFGLYQYQWGDGTVGNELTVSPDATSSYYLTVSDTCMSSPTIAEYVVVVTAYPDIQVELPADIEVGCGAEEVSVTALVADGGNGPLAYDWTANGLTIGTGQTVDLTVDEDITLILELTDECGSVSSDEMILDFLTPSPLSVDLIGEYSTDCLSPEVVIAPDILTGGQGPYTFEWSVNGELSGVVAEQIVLMTDSDTPVLEVVLTVTDACGSVFSDESTVTFQDPPPLDVELDADFFTDCLDPEVVVAPELVTNAQGELGYQWVINGEVVSNEEQVTVTADSNWPIVDIVLTLTDQCGSTFSAESTVTYQPPPPIEVQLPVQFYTDCLDPEVDVTAIDVNGGQGALSFSWSIDGVVVGEEEEVTVTATADLPLVDVLLTVTDECGMTSSGESTVLFQPPPPIAIELPDTIRLYCGETAVNITPLSITGGAGALEYTWTSGGSLISNEYELITATDVDQIYQLQVTDACGYSAQQEASVVVVEYIPLELSASNDTSVCPGLSIQIEAISSGGLEPLVYAWSHGLPDVSAVVSVSPATTTIYSVTATDACGNSEADDIHVDIAELEADFILENDGYHGFITINTSTHNEGDSVHYIWMIDGDVVGQDIHLTLQYPDMEDHEVTLVIENEIGCSDSKSTQTAPPPTLYVPSGFTPNADGLNDQFVVKGINIKKYHIRIHDQWDGVVFESEDLSTPWLGEAEAEAAHYGQDAIYMYRIIAEGENGEFFDHEGTITLIR